MGKKIINYFRTRKMNKIYKKLKQTRKLICNIIGEYGFIDRKNLFNRLEELSDIEQSLYDTEDLIKLD